MPPIKHAPARNHHTGPYDRPQHTRIKGIEAVSQDLDDDSNGMLDSNEKPSKPSLLGTPGRLISGVISWLSPWKSKNQTSDQDSQSDSDADNSSPISRSLPCADERDGGTGRNRDAGLALFAEDAVDTSQSNRKDGGRQADLSGYSDDFFEQNALRHETRVSYEQFSDYQSNGIVRPRAIAKADPLAVARVVSRMGATSRDRKRQIANRLASKTHKRYAILSQPPDPDGGEPSAFRVVVVTPQTSSHSNWPASARAGSLPAVADSSIFGTESRSLNVSANSVGGTFLNASLLNISALDTSTATANGYAPPRRSGTSTGGNAGSLAIDRGSLSAKEFSDKALASINSALAPRQPGAHSIVMRDHYSPMNAFERRETDASCPGSLRVGGKRQRESFAPEPSPIRKFDDAELKARPAQRPRTSSGTHILSHRNVPQQKSAQTVRRILEIIKDTSTPASAARSGPTARFFTSTATAESAIHRDNLDDDQGNRRGNSFADSFERAQKKERTFTFSAPEAITVENSLLARPSLENLPRPSRPGRTFTFSDPDNVAATSDSVGHQEANSRAQADSFESESSNASSANDPLAAKAREREEQKRALAAKAGVPSKFQWPDKKVEVRLEASGNKELDQEDGFAPAPPQAAPPPAAKGGQYGGANGSGGQGMVSLADLFKPKPGEWRCSVCMTLNKADAVAKCPSCETPRPGAAPAAPAAASVGTFKFGVDSSAASGGFKFGADSAVSGGFKFGADTPAQGVLKSASEVPPASASGFKFGADPPAQTSSKPSSDTTAAGGFKFGSDATSAGGFKIGGDTGTIAGGFSVGTSSSAANGMSSNNHSTTPILFGATSVATTATSGGFTFGGEAVKSNTANFKFDSQSIPALTSGSASSSASQSNGLPASNPFAINNSSNGAQATGITSQFSFGNAMKPSTAADGNKSASLVGTSASSSAVSSDGVGRKMSNEEERKAKEREEQKKALAAKAGVPTKFQWPEKKLEVGLESSGNKEVDEGGADDDNADGGSSLPSSGLQFAFSTAKTPAQAPSAAPMFSIGGSAQPTFSFGASGSSAVSSSTAPTFSFGAGSAAALPGSAAGLTSSVFSFGAPNSSSAFSSSAPHSSSASSSLDSSSSASAQPASLASAPFTFGAGTNIATGSLTGATSQFTNSSSVTGTVSAPFSFNSSSGTSALSGSGSAPAFPSTSFSFTGGSGLGPIASTTTSQSTSVAASNPSNVSASNVSQSGSASGFSFSGTFGAASAAPPSAPASTFVFGGTSTASTGAGAFTFGSVGSGSAPAAASTSGAFGQAGASSNSGAPFMFGSAAGKVENAGTAGGASAFTFGGSNTAPSAQAAVNQHFGGQGADGMMADDEASVPASAGGFGFAAPPSTGAVGMFGASSASAPSSAAAPFTFGGSNSGGFGRGGGAPAASNSSSAFAFSAPNTAGSAFGSGFGAPGSTPAFGASPFAAQSSAPAFGSAAPTFGNAMGGATPAFGGGFGAQSTTPAFAFGASSASAFGGGGFGAPSSGPAFGGFGAQSSGGAFGGFNAQASTPATAFGGFGAQPTGAAFGGAPPAQTTASSFGGFGAAAAPVGFGAAAAAPAAAGFGAGGFGAQGGGGGGGGVDVPQRKMIKAKRSTSQGRGRGH